MTVVIHNLMRNCFQYLTPLFYTYCNPLGRPIFIGVDIYYGRFMLLK